MARSLRAVTYLIYRTHTVMTLKRIIPLVAILTSIASSVDAARIIVSGDANILNPLAGGGGLAINAGNQRFFDNVLGTGSKVLVDSDGFNGAAFSGFLDTYYTSQGKSVTTTVLPVTSLALASIDLFATIVPNSPYSTSELSAMRSYLSDGGTIFFFGDQSFFSQNNARINEALVALGSSILISNGSVRGGNPSFATGPQIAANPLTQGVDSLAYSVGSELTVSGGTALFFGPNGRAFVATETISVPDSGSSSLLLAVGILALWGVRRRISR